MTLLAAYLTTYVLILSTGVGETIFGGAFLDEHDLLDALTALRPLLGFVAALFIQPLPRSSIH